MILEYFSFSLKNLRKKKLRSFLTLLGIIISIATLFILISVSLGLQESVKEQFKLLGTDKFFIMPKGQFGSPGSESAAVLTESDVNAIKKIVGIKAVIYFSFGNAKVEFSKESRYVSVTGIPLDTGEVLIETGIYQIDEGRFLKRAERGRAILGSRYKSSSLFTKEVSLKDTIIINGKEFSVSAILKPVGNPIDDRNIIIPVEDFREIFPNSSRIDQILVQINENEDIKEITGKVEKRLKDLRGVTEKTQDFSVLTPEELLSSFKSVLNIITVFLTGIAAISLLIGGIIITNTMYTSVLERTQEIGVMKAIGAQNKDILLIFLLEAGLLGLFGGFFGVILGFGITEIIVYIASQQLGTSLLKAAAPIYLILGSLSFAFFVGIISGVLPAWRATKIKIVDALRYE